MTHRISMVFMVVLSVLFSIVSAEAVYYGRSFTGGIAGCELYVPGGSVVAERDPREQKHGSQGTLTIEKGDFKKVYTVSVATEKVSMQQLGPKRTRFEKTGVLEIAKDIQLIAVCSVDSVPAASNCDFEKMRNSCSVCTDDGCERAHWTIRDERGRAVRFKIVKPEARLLNP